MRSRRVLLKMKAGQISVLVNIIELRFFNLKLALHIQTYMYERDLCCHVGSRGGAPWKPLLIQAMTDPFLISNATFLGDVGNRCHRRKQAAFPAEHQRLPSFDQLYREWKNSLWRIVHLTRETGNRTSHVVLWHDSTRLWLDWVKYTNSIVEFVFVPNATQTQARGNDTAILRY